MNCMNDGLKERKIHQTNGGFRKMVLNMIWPSILDFLGVDDFDFITTEDDGDISG